ncbi:TetR/AcrR family transcriptional regulator [Arthrobacter sp. CDRTa11]|uniref:ScbR family autoregulator-binding transcription factor n=1 Tax=Arthrobacter sp. CDRTa11 TaxID=2651199 RepID=UPI002265B351|nr:ScbR family autoregulator-binding transcription factor [Arthrobacter sp. CDRTa11]UZX01749.1 TetR/AcrR family transcriptional regulator [Arthrobacter sp. CDRTa11]
MPLQERAKATKVSIVEGAAAVFEEIGYGNTSLSSVAERAGVTKGALYFHFKSKEDLALAVIESQHEVVSREGQRVADLGRGALSTMIMTCGGFGRLLVEEPIVRAGIRLTLEASAFGQSVTRPYHDWIHTMELLTRQGQTEGDIHESVDAAAFARYLVASFTGVQMVSGILTHRADVLRRIEDMWSILLPGMVPDAKLPEFLAVAHLSIRGADSAEDHSVD